MQYIFIVIILAGYGLLNYYVGLRSFQGISALIPVNKAIYWTIIVLLAVMFFVSMAVGKRIPAKLGSLLHLVGGYWLAAVVYLLFFVLLIDIFRVVANKLDIMPAVLKGNPVFATLVVAVAMAVILIVGTYNAIVPTVVEYNVNINKKAGDIKKLKVAMISDVHLGELIKRDRLKKAVEMMNGLQPDLVVIVGDLIDNNIVPVARDNMLEELKNIKSRYGAFAIMGNHEQYGGKTDEITRMIEENGVTVLRDKAVKIQDSFYLVGREDMAADMRGYKRKELGELLSERDSDLPVIVLDHQPSALKEARSQKIDLQLSGHTHAGQFFPASLVTSIMYEEDNGYLKDGDFNLIVSSGFGSWGPMVRIGSRSQVLSINVAFTGE